MAYRSFEELEVWKRGRQLAVEVFRETDAFRSFALRDQMQRAALSIPRNIAEGYERDSSKDFVRFLRIAKASAAELRTQLYVAQDLELVSGEKINHFLNETREIGAMIQGLARSRMARNPST